jgi:hypothetical protein
MEANMTETADLFDEFSQKCPICLMGMPILIDDTDNPDRVLIPMQPIFAYQCDTCGWKCAGHIKQGKWIDILDERWKETSKNYIASARYRLGISIIANRLSAYEFYFTHQMVA